MYKADWRKYRLHFKKPSGTSRGELTFKDSWFIKVWSANDPSNYGIGECGLLAGLSVDDRPEYETKLDQVCQNIPDPDELSDYPSIRFGLEMALIDLKKSSDFIYFPSQFVQGQKHVEINGLIWMGSKQDMRSQIIDKIESGYRCLKLKIGAINFSDEVDLIKYIRSEFSEEDMEIRVDANGAFSPDNALEKLKTLSDQKLHSIEQPIRAGQIDEMSYLCSKTPLPIALDEELIGVNSVKRKQKLIEDIQPQYIILKPSLVGGYKSCQEWIQEAEANETGWWVTSALESNIGLNAIAQWTATLSNPMPQGLGTGGLYTNNFTSPLYIEKGRLKYDSMGTWNFNLFN